MIQANELRVGNWVEIYDAPKIYKSENGICQVEAMTLHYMGYDGEIKLRGIPLTHEILEKCGFVINRNGELSIEINDIASHLELMQGVDSFYYPSLTQTPQGDEERSVYFNRINSLHQLQNLYFALTGEELNYSPTH